MEAQDEFRRQIMAIMSDSTLTDVEKAQKRQKLMCSRWLTNNGAEDEDKENAAGAGEVAGKAKNSVIEDETLQCTICLNLCDRPVTASCQHNFCLACFKKWVQQSKKTCPTCRAPFARSFIENPRINTALASAIRLAKSGASENAAGARPYVRIDNASRPDEAFTTDRAVRNGRANAASGRIRVTTPNDHFGPIEAKYDPERNRGVLVGDWWKDRLDCRQWGAHFPHVAGIAGQSNVGAQSVVLSGGYEDDRDEGEWFLYTGSGGRDLSGNKRTSKTQSFDQVFKSYNEALQRSCLKGLPVRVVRSYKEKRSAYAPPEDTPVRYDGVYRIAACWRKKGAQGFLMCRYLFVRCDNAPAPWSSSETGDEPRTDLPVEAVPEMKGAHQGKVYEMAANPFWDYDPVMKQWGWAKPAPPSACAPGGGDATRVARRKVSERERLLKEFSCGLCRHTLTQPVSTPCGHNFCKGCLDLQFTGVADSFQPGTGGGGRTLRVRKIPKPCPSCRLDISDFLGVAVVNREMESVIAKLKAEVEAAKAEAAAEAASGADADATQEDGEGNVEGNAAGDNAEDDDAEEDGMASGGDTQNADASLTPLPVQETAAAAADMAQGDVAGGVGSDKAGGSVQQSQDGPVAASVSAAPSNGTAVGGRYTAELAALLADFPEFDAELIRGLLEDQGGDAVEVHFYLKRIKNAKPRNATPRKPGTAGAGTKRGRAAVAKAAPTAPGGDDSIEGSARDTAVQPLVDGEGLGDENKRDAGPAGARCSPPDMHVPAEDMGVEGEAKEGTLDTAQGRKQGKRRRV